MHVFWHRKLLDPHYNVYSFVACMLRLAGHDFMDFRPDESSWKVGGSDGCLNFNDPDNKGLPSCIIQFKLNDVLDKHKDKISVADFIVLAAEAAIAVSSEGFDKESPYEGGAFADDLMLSFRYGRTTRETCSWNTGRMPNPEHGVHGNGLGENGLQTVFIDNVYRG